MIKKVIVCVVFLLLSVVGYYATAGLASDPEQVYLAKMLDEGREVYLLKGELAGEYPVSMTLAFEKDTIVGSYVFSNSEPMKLSGKIEDDSYRFWATVENEGIVDTTGVFVLDKAFNGVWQNTDRTGRNLGNDIKRVDLEPASESFQSYRVRKYLYEYDIPFPGKPGSSTSVNFDIEYLELIGSTQAVTFINRLMREEYVEAAKNSGSMYNDVLKQIAEFGDGPFGISNISHYSVEYADDRLVSINNSGYSYAGGAHGISYYINQVYSLETGEIITLDEIFKDGENRKLVALLRKKLLEVREGKSSYFEFDQIRLNGNFLVNDRGIEFTYGHYEICAYAIGMPTVFFSWDELKSFVRKDSPVRYLLKGRSKR